MGGHAREIRALVDQINMVQPSYEVLGHVVTEPKFVTPNSPYLLGDYSWLEQNRAKIDALFLAIGYPQVREKARQALGPLADAFDWPTLIHPHAVLDRETCQLGRGSMIAAGCVLTASVTIGDWVVLNPQVLVSHDCSIGSGASLFGQSRLAGGVRVGARCVIGMGASVIEGRVIGDNSVVGAGAVVTRDVPPDSRVAGVPARLLAPSTR